MTNLPPTHRRGAPAPLAGLEFTREQIEQAQADRRLLSIELETTYLCNLRCTYCYSDAGRKRNDELSFQQLVDVVQQAKALGARKVVLLGGGEPCMDKRLCDLIDEIHHRDLSVELFTNGTLIDQSLAKFLFERHVAVVVKVNSMRPDIQDLLAGVPDCLPRIHRGLQHLKEAGYPDDRHGLGIQTVICRQNLDEMEDLWRWVRRQNIQPYFEILTQQGRCETNENLLVSPQTLAELFARLSTIDREEFGHHWTPQPPIAGHQCQRHLYSILVRANGEIRPCVGVPITLGNVTEDQLATVLDAHPVLDDLRNVGQRIKGPCGSCDLGTNLLRLPGQRVPHDRGLSRKRLLLLALRQGSAVGSGLMRILLISANTQTNPAPAYPLALPRLAAALTTDNHDVHVLDLLVDGTNPLVELIRTQQPELIGVSLRNVDNLDARNPKSHLRGYQTLVETLRSISSAPIVLGGSAFSIFPERFLDRLGADYGIMGPGEAALCDLARALAGGQGPARGLITEQHRAGLCPSMAHVRHEDRLVSYYWRESGMIGVQTKRGCPHACAYCTYPLVDGSQIAYAPPGQIADQIEQLHRDWDVRYVFMVDSVFNLNPAQEVALAEEIIARNLPIAWGAFFSPRNLDRPYIQSLIDSGLTHMEFGTDSLADPVLAAMGKGFTTADVAHTAKLCATLDVHCAHYLTFGGPGETTETVDETMRHARQIESCVFFPFVTLRLFPHTPLHDIAVAQGQASPDPADLLEPTFYLAPSLTADQVWQQVRKQADGHRWILPEHVTRIQPMLKRMRQQGRAGPLWEDLVG